MSRTCVGTGRNLNAKRGAFTLIEVLVVVAIIALLISILLPSLRQARDVSKMMVCQSHLKEMGNAMSMYFIDYKDMLPGPCHPLMLKYPMGGGASATEKESQETREWYVSTRLRKYFSERARGNGTMTQQVGICPSFPIPDSTFVMEKISIYNYALNTSAVTGPKYYFGFAHGGLTGWKDWIAAYDGKGDLMRSKKLSRILGGGVSAGSEWMAADAFRRPLKQGVGSGGWPYKDEPGYDAFPPIGAANINDQWGSMSSELLNLTSTQASGRVAPYAPFHPNQGGYKRESIGGATKTIFTGKANTLFFDMHVEAQNKWKGTTSPYWERNNSKK